MNKIYKCSICGNIVELIHSGGGELVCCGQPMDIQKEKKKEEGTEKHLPIIKSTEDGVEINVGEINHPMEENHNIEWIEVVANKGNFRKYLKPGDKPKANFCLKIEEIKSVREYCNIHGLWVNK